MHLDQQQSELVSAEIYTAKKLRQYPYHFPSSSSIWGKWDCRGFK